MGWIFIVLGLLIRTPTTVMTLGFTLLFPLVFASNIMVDPATMPGWLRAVVEANPISLDDDGDPRADGRRARRSGRWRWRWPFPAVLTLVLAPVTLWLYARK